MKKIMFVCHGNICRSPMAEYVFRHLAQKKGFDCLVSSSAVSREEIGSDVYPPAKRELLLHGVPCPSRAARQITEEDVKTFDYILCMDGSNLSRLCRISPEAKEKARLLGEFGLNGKEIEDPWYTGRFDRVFEEISLCSENLLSLLLRER